MPVTTTEAGRAALMTGDDPRLTDNATAKFARKQEEARRAADALNGRVDTTTPLGTVGRAPLETLPNTPTTPLGTVGRAPLETLPNTPAAPAKPEKPAHRITVQTTVEHRGRSFTISADGITLDEFCDLLDKRGYVAAGQTREWQTLPDGTPICPRHHAPMRKRERQGDTWFSHNVGTTEKPCYCKGYRGKDSPGYEVE